MRFKLAVAFLMTVGATVPVLLTGPQPVSAAGKLTPSERRCFEVSGDPGGAALVNLTPVLATGAGDGQLVSSDVSDPPVASNVNFRPGVVDPNVAVASIGADGEVCFVNSVHTNVHLVADHLGTIGSSAYAPAKASGAPDRRVDTRSGLGGGKIGPSGRRCFSVSGSPGDAAIVNLTPVLAEASGDGQLVSSDVANLPVASNVNFRPGSVDPNVAIARIGADGEVCFVNSVHTNVHLVADHLGTIGASAYSPAKASGAPDRRVDTRNGQGGTKIGPAGRLCFAVSGDPGDAALVNLTPVLAEGAGDGQLVSSDVTDPPVASNVNFRPGSVDPNVAIVPIGADGRVCYVNSIHTSVHLVADHLGTISKSVYSSATASGAPGRRVDTRFLSGIEAISTASASSCALTEDGAVLCWGFWTGGTVGLGAFQDPFPRVMPGLSGSAIQLSGNASHSCALVAGGSAYCWGLNFHGQLGASTATESVYDPVRVVGLSGATSIGTGSTHSCAVRLDRTAVCWGDNAQGQLGDGTTTNRQTPTAVQGLTNVASIAGGEWHSCALHSDGTVSCWGWNGWGQVGPTSSITPVKVLGLSDVVDLSVGAYHNCALRADGTVTCWGQNDFGQLGDGQSGTNSTTPQEVPGLNSITDVEAGALHTCAIRDASEVLCWGRNISGQLGDGTDTNRSVPTRVAGLGKSVADLSAMTNHTCAVLGDSTVWCWGSGLAVGTGDQAGSFIPRPVRTGN